MGGQLKAWPDEARTLDEILIGDGLCYRGYVAAVPRHHGAFQYAYRPMLPAEITATQHRINTLSDSGKKEEAEGLVARVISEHLTWNSVTDGPLTPAQVNKLPNQVYNTVYLQLIGLREMDEGYDWNPDDESEQPASRKTSTQQLADDVKN